ncbi:flagellar protein [Salipaludibacillus keqinensis]|jgi:flagellar protein FliT|uniref:Flagellar protein FliT n=1 Tax=Salipaludibacillus keqinensis TaxID=2045207 RepID=A0A323TG09_9BACI|nr:flagellar protein [Salipaludibacillus keqinensis]PYZ92814.1 flagellar protein [Salipaludibacillus keqinensis]
MSVLHDLHQLTKQLHDHLAEPLPKDEGREAYIETIDSYLGKRQALLNQLKRPEGEEETKLANELIEMNERVNERMQAVQGEIRMDINQLKKRKSTGKKYENPYDGPTADGVFFDSKK